MSGDSEVTTIPHVFQMRKDTKANLDALTGLKDGDMAYGTDTYCIYRQNGNGAANWETIVYYSPLVIVVRKAADEAVNNSIVLQNDDELLFPMEASKTYSVKLQLLADGVAASHIRFQPILPAGAEVYYYSVYIAVGNVDTQATKVTGEAITNLRANTTPTIRTSGVFEFLVINGVNAGNFQLQWAQSSAVVGNTFVRAGSCLIATKLN